MNTAAIRRGVRGVSGLRGRLVVTVVAVAVLGAGAAAWSGVQRSTASLIDVTQRYHTEDVVGRITQAAPSVQYPPDRESLDQLRTAAGADSLVRYDQTVSDDGVFAAGTLVVPAAMREAMSAQVEAGDARVLTERVVADGTPWLVIGVPLMITAPDGTRTFSGIEVYAARDLTAVQHQVDDLVRGAAATTLVVLPLAILLALLTSRGVLRPVARLRETARRLARGELDARTEPTGVDELAGLTRAVNDMAASLQDSIESMARLEEGSRRFAADVSHELRTPLTTLAAAVEVLHDVLADENGVSASDEEEARESAQLAVAETRRLMELVEDIMEIARLDAGTADLRWEQTDLWEMLDACVRTRGWSDDVTIAAPAQSPGARTVVADRRRVDVIMANLIGNALTHGGAPVRVAVETTEETASVQVVDSGPGIPAQMIPRLFARFSKADGSRTRTPGSGLGLAIARENAVLHGGTITAVNNPEGGATFTLRLPRGRGRATGETDEAGL